jgi:Predicted AAA-ATPase/PD-(D/E)XK nuclease superfamily
MSWIMKKLPIGISDYKKVIEDNYYYVDKTLLIKELLEVSANVTLITRPRRFGKTLNLSMLKYFFDCSNSGIENAHLFHNTKIWTYPEYRSHQGKYPVIYLTFKDSKENTWPLSYDKIGLAIAKEYNHHRYLLEDHTLAQFEMDKFKRIQASIASVAELSDSIHFLSELIFRHCNKKVIIMLDEYDVPIHAAYSCGYYQETVDFIRSLLTAAFKDNKYLERGILIGVSHMAKEGISSGLNNLSVFTVTDPDFSNKFGFTDMEVQELFADMHLSTPHTEIKRQYDGYTFGYTHGLYNPWSILCCACNNGTLDPYWVNTSDNELIKKLIAQASKTVKSELEQLLKGNTVAQEVDGSLTLPSMEHNSAALWSLLLYAGYLTYTSCESKGNKKLCLLTIPNTEIYHLYVDLIQSIFMQVTAQGEYGTDLLQALITGDTPLFSRLLQSFILNSMSIHDLPSNEPEKSYHLFVLGLLVMLGDRYEVKSNRESGYGRYDIMLIPKDTQENGIIIEFKKVPSGETLEDAADQGLEQIIHKQYAQELYSRNIQHIIAYGIAFEGKKVFAKSQKLDSYL